MIKRFFLLVMLVALSASAAISAKTNNKVWDAPEATVNKKLDLWKTKLRISRVEFTPEETVVYVTMAKSSGEGFKYNKNTYLLVDTVKYPVVSVEGVELGKREEMDNTGIREMVFRFKPLPMSTESFDFIDGRLKTGYSLSGVRDRGNSLSGTNWRDVKTGDWLIGFMPNFAVYDSKVWQYKEKDFARGCFVLTDGSSTLKVEAGKPKGGVRELRLGDRRVKVSRIDGISLGTYPDKSDLREFVNNGYRAGDSVTINGCFVNSPDEVKEVGLMVNNLIEEDQFINIPVDSLGFFSMTFPVVNTQGITFDYGRLNLKTTIEPGETYFFLGDMGNPQFLWMGRKSRLLNELMIYPLNGRAEPRSVDTQAEKVKLMTDFLNSYANLVDSLAAANPTLSPLWADWHKQQKLQQTAFQAGQTKFSTSDIMISPEVSEFIETIVRPSLKTPETAWYPHSLSGFYRDYFQDCVERSPYAYSLPYTNKKTIPYWVSQETWEALHDSIESMRVEIAISKFVDKQLPSALKTKAKEFYENLISRDVALGYDKNGSRTKVEAMIKMIDSMKLSPYESDLLVARELISIMDKTQEALGAEYDAIIDNHISNEAIRQMVASKKKDYESLVAVEVEEGSCEMVPAEELLSAKSGKELFDKALEPFRGHVVIVDVWGVWCGSCVSSLKNFQETREGLEPYGVVFMFFASNSEEKRWREIIKSLNVTGDNVVHYNLPEAQQNMLEHYLNITSYPAQRLVNADGTLLNIPVEVRLVQTLEKLIPKKEEK